MLIHLIAAARPNFMKIAPLYHALHLEDWANPMIVHTGQHYDLNMSDAFFEDLRLPEPDIHLGIGSGTHAEQTGKVMMAYEKVIIDQHPDLVIVVGDVNSTVAATLAASKIQYPQITTKNGDSKRSLFHEPSASSHERGHRPFIAHLEAGLRSFDRSMPEEINRLVTDTLADILWTPSSDADENLIHEGIATEKIVRVGNIMIDSLEMMRASIEKQAVYKEFGVRKDDYGLVTLHRPSNVDDPATLEAVCEALIGISEKIPLIFPVHPRTRNNLENYGLIDRIHDSHGIHLSEPINYIRFMNLVFNCRLVITDSGGIQEETTYLGIPCLTLRPNTERPVTIEQGTNQLCAHQDLENLVEKILDEKVKNRKIPDLWDGKTATRVVESIKNIFRI